MDANSITNAYANAEAGGSTIALHELCSGELKTYRIYKKILYSDEGDLKFLVKGGIL